MKSNSLEIPDTEELIESLKIKIVKSLSEDEASGVGHSRSLRPETSKSCLAQLKESSSEKDINNLKNNSLAGKWTNNFKQESSQNFFNHKISQKIRIKAEESKMSEQGNDENKNEKASGIKEDEPKETEAKRANSFESDAPVSVNYSSEQNPNSEKPTESEPRIENPPISALASLETKTHNLPDKTTLSLSNGASKPKPTCESEVCFTF